MVAAHIAHEAGVKIILDPAPPISLPDELFQMVSVIKPNSSEAEALTDIQVKDRDSAREAAKHLIERGVGAVAVQADGSYAFTLALDPASNSDKNGRTYWITVQARDLAGNAGSGATSVTVPRR